MNQNQGYHFDQDRTPSAQNNNNSTYIKMEYRFKKLRPIFEKEKFNVFNCNPYSNLKVFPYVDFETAMRLSTNNMPIDIINERTAGLYEREKLEKDTTKEKEKVAKAERKLQDRIKKLEKEMNKKRKEKKKEKA
jgi:predicted ribosome quality control (RQC) complex YloA/Tae2 family protein